MAREKVEDMIRKAYMVFEANTEYAGQPWELPANVLTDFTAAFNELRTLDAASTESRTQKENVCAKSAAEQKKCEQIVWDLKKFIKVVQSDKTLQEQMFHDLGIDEDLPGGDTDLITILYEQLKPHLDDWDGSPQEIDSDMKTAINAQITAYSTAVGGCDEWKANATTATEAVRQATETFVSERARVRNWLYLKLPDGKYDAHLDEYGFEIWNKPTYGGGEEPQPGATKFPGAVTGLKVTIDELGNIRIVWPEYGEDVLFNLYKAKAKTGYPAPERPVTPEMANMSVLSYTDTDVQNNTAYYYWVVAVKGGVEGDFGDAVMVEYKPGAEPIVPR